MTDERKQKTSGRTTAGTKFSSTASIASKPDCRPDSSLFLGVNEKRCDAYMTEWRQDIFIRRSCFLSYNRTEKQTRSYSFTVVANNSHLQHWRKMFPWRRSVSSTHPSSLQKLEHRNPRRRLQHETQRGATVCRWRANIQRGRIGSFFKLSFTVDPSSSSSEVVMLFSLHDSTSLRAHSAKKKKTSKWAESLDTSRPGGSKNSGRWVSKLCWACRTGR